MFSRGGETLRIDGYLTLSLLTHGNLAVYHRLMKYVDPRPLLELTHVFRPTNVLRD